MLWVTSMTGRLSASRTFSASSAADFWVMVAGTLRIVCRLSSPSTKNDSKACNWVPNGSSPRLRVPKVSSW